MQYLTIEEVKAVLSHAADEEERLMFLLAFWHGLRAEEIVGVSDHLVLKRRGLKPNDSVGLKGSNIADGFVTVQRLKGSKKTHQPYINHEDPLLDESRPLKALAKETGARQVLFPDWTRFNFRYAFAKAAKKAGLPKHKQHPHCLKHSIAKHTIDGAGIQNVRQWLGHKSIQSTGQYLEVDDETAAKAVTAIVGGK